MNSGKSLQQIISGLGFLVIFGKLGYIQVEFRIFIKSGPNWDAVRVFFLNPYPTLFLIGQGKIRPIKVKPGTRRSGKNCHPYLQIRNKNTLKKILKDNKQVCQDHGRSRNCCSDWFEHYSGRQNLNCLNLVVNSFEVDLSLSLSLSLSLYIYIQGCLYMSMDGWMDGCFSQLGGKEKGTVFNN